MEEAALFKIEKQVRACRWCGEDLGHRRSAKYCDNSCLKKHKHQISMVSEFYKEKLCQCPQCSNKFHSTDKRKIYCSETCRIKVKNRKASKRLYARKQGMKRMGKRICPNCSDYLPMQKPVNAIYCSRQCKDAYTNKKEAEARAKRKADIMRGKQCVNPKCKQPIPLTRSPHAKYCGNKCRNRHRSILYAEKQKMERSKNKPIRTCEYWQCSNRIPKTARHDKRFCSDECASCHHIERKVSAKKLESLRKKMGRICQHEACNNPIPLHRNANSKYCCVECKVMATKKKIFLEKPIEEVLQTEIRIEGEAYLNKAERIMAKNAKLKEQRVKEDYDTKLYLGWKKK